MTKTLFQSLAVLIALAHSGLAFAQSKCSNPIQLEEDGLLPIANSSELKPGHYSLISLEMHVYNEQSGDSFTAIAEHTRGFKVALQCADIKNQSDDVSGSFDVSDWLEIGENGSKSETKSQIRVAFSNGKLIESIVKSVTDKTGPENNLKVIPLERVGLGSGAFATVRIYEPVPGTLDVRIKFELPTGVEGKMVIEHARAIYN